MGLFDKFKKNEQQVATPQNSPEKSRIETKKEKAIQYVKSIVEGIGFDNTAEIIEDEKGIVVNFVNADIVGQKGELIDAIQYLVSTIVNRRESDFFRVSINCNGYRERRCEELENLTVNFCKTVVRTGVSAAMTAMNAYERRIVHSKISEIDGVYSKSTGEEPNRKIIIYPEKPKDRDSVTNRNGNNRRKNDRNDFQKSREYVPRNLKPLDIGTSFEKDLYKDK